jgi:hypothetical protein
LSIWRASSQESLCGGNTPGRRRSLTCAF